MSDESRKPGPAGGFAPKVPPPSAVPRPPVVPPPSAVPPVANIPRMTKVPPAAKVPPIGKMPSVTKVPPVIARLIGQSKPIAVRKHSLLTPEELERFRNLLVFARSTVEGYFVGKHKSPHRGSSVEFADYKEYVPGDEMNRIDWRAYARTRRLFVRQYEAETDMVVYLMVDVSASMNYAGKGRQSKYVIAAKIAAALAYLMLRQGDKASLVLFAHTLTRFLAPGGTRRHLHNLVSELEQIEPSSTTGIADALHHCNALFRKRGRIIILSDFWTDHAEFLDAMAQLVHRNFEILLLHVLDPDELELPATNAARFQDMETQEQVEVELEEIRSAYSEGVKERIQRLAFDANSRRVNHAVVNTRNPYLEAIEAYMGFRARNLVSTS
jgi:uncharacterized protein (DUF58 family)